MVQNAIQLPFPDRVQYLAMLLAQLLLPLRVSDLWLPCRGRVGNSLLADTASTHEDLRLQQQITLARLALHVVDSVTVFYVGIEAENHRQFLIL